MGYRETGLLSIDPLEIVSILRKGDFSRERVHRLVDEEYNRAESACSTQNLVEVTATNFITPFTDEEATALLVANGKSEDEARTVVLNWRRFAKEVFDWDSKPIIYRVKAGFTLKKHAPQSGNYYKDWEYLQEQNLKNDVPTQDSFVFWIPRIVENSTGKNVLEQKSLLAELRKEYELPENHLASFGDASLLSALVLFHYEQTNERVPLKCLCVRTDTLRVDGSRLELGGFDGDGLDCGIWDWGDNRNSSLGCFALGVETLERLNT